MILPLNAAIINLQRSGSHWISSAPNTTDKFLMFPAKAQFLIAFSRDFASLGRKYVQHWEDWHFHIGIKKRFEAALKVWDADLDWSVNEKQLSR